jgi:hypothetical protein
LAQFLEKSSDTTEKLDYQGRISDWTEMCKLSRNLMLLLDHEVFSWLRAASYGVIETTLTMSCNLLEHGIDHLTHDRQ